MKGKDKPPIQLTRREFLRTTGAIAAAVTTGDPVKIATTVGSDVAPIAATMPIPAINALINRLATAFDGLANCHDYDLAETFFGSESDPATSDEFFTTLTKAISELYNNASTYAASLEELRPLKKEAFATLNPAIEEVKAFDDWRWTLDHKTAIDLMRKWINDKSKSAAEKMEEFKKQYLHVTSIDGGPSPFETTFVDWTQPADG